MTMRFLALISLCLTTLALPAQARAPVVVELFTAQGCASCGDANAWLGKLAERPDTLVLTFPVDYWDYLGWTDTFAKPEFADRQKAYVARMALREPYTPQVVIDGRSQAACKPKRSRPCSPRPSASPTTARTSASSAPVAPMSARAR